MMMMMMMTVMTVIKFSSFLYYKCAGSTAVWPIAGTAQKRNRM
jgi:hypothetical protein